MSLKRDRLLDLLSRNSITELINVLLDNDLGGHYNDRVVLLSHSYNSLLRSEARGLISRNEYSTKVNKIIEALLEIIDNIPIESNVKKNNLRMNVDGKWNAFDVGVFFMTLNRLYVFFTLIEVLKQSDLKGDKELKNSTRRVMIANQYIPLNRILLAFLPSSSLMEDKELGKYFREFTSLRRIDYQKLEVLRLKYSSPGSFDLVGFGAVVGHIKDLVINLLEGKRTKTKRDLENEKLKIQNDVLKLERNIKQAELLEKVGISSKEIRQIFLQKLNDEYNIIELLNEGKIKGIE